MQLSVIILNYNVRYFLEHCILSVQKAIQNLDAEIIVVDNNSPDDSCDMVKTLFSNVILIENQENLGFPKGNNIGVAQAKGNYICILNPDTVVAEDTFTKILNTKNWQLNTGIIGCKLIDGTGNFLPESKRGIPTPMVAFGKTFGLYKMFPKVKIFQKYYAEHLNQNTSGNVDILVGAFMVMKKETYQKVGGFDERYFMYGEDIDLSYAALKLGLQNYYFAETSIIHYKGESTVKDEKYRQRFQQGMELFYAKHMKSSVFFNSFMKVGMLFFATIKMKSNAKISKSQPMHYVLYSNDMELKTKLEQKLKKKIQLKNSSLSEKCASQSLCSEMTTEVILDTNSHSYKACIAFLEQNKNKNISFKIKPVDANFIIGSNNSNDRGEVILL
ncbi:glycosyltransferase family 2 protein [Flavobacterium tegetincola]|uniref:glycosyltransferase family 2 protein n=1 Tax=Flavobacterium tegetincola TaxID=150172 RepID=UPI0004169BC3|nr:glycosyltransferase family 2 protein [Flavobacterium tegetincola]